MAHLTLVAGFVLAAAAWGFMFLPPREWFWPRAAAAGLAIGAYAVAVHPATMWHLLDRRHWPADLGVGVGTAVALFVIFWIGEQLLVIVVPPLADEVTDLYAVKKEAVREFVPLVLLLAASGEELFFRGFLQRREGFVVALVLYAAVHLWERKVVLILAALAGGAAWGGLLWWTGGLVAPLVSHVLWDLMIVVWQPARPLPWARRLSSRLHPSIR